MQRQRNVGQYLTDINARSLQKSKNINKDYPNCNPYKGSMSALLIMFSLLFYISSAQAVSRCGYEGQRGCCAGDGTLWGDNPVPGSAGCYGTRAGGVNNLAEVVGNVPEPSVCGGFNPGEIFKSSGHCEVCGSEGVRKCANDLFGNGGITKNNECKEYLTPDILGYCIPCGGEGQTLCRAEVEDFMCKEGFHPDLGVCRADQTIAEPDCNCTPEDQPANTINEPVNGYADLHLHMFSNLAFGGLTLWGDAFNRDAGISQALRGDDFAQRTDDYVLNGHVKQGINEERVPIDDIRKQQLVHGTNHFNDIVGGGTGQQGPFGFGGSLLNSGVEWAGNDDSKHFLGWPKWNSTTHQQSYYKWLERAHRGGLQLAVMLAVNNEAMCVSGRSLDYDVFDCAKTMKGIDLQISKAKEFEEWLQLQCKNGDSTACATGSTTLGWFRIVQSSAQARKTIANGQLAVVLGIEEANLFDCNDGKCSSEHVQSQVNEYHRKGVRHIFPIHNFDNDYGGAATWMDTIAVGNKYSTDAWYETENCPDTPASFDGESGYGFKLEPSITDWLAALVLGTEWDLPSYWTGLTTSCNQLGLKDLGKDLVKQLMSKGMIIDVDHMSIKALDDTLTIAEDNNYPGIVASHALMFDLTKKQYRHERMRTENQLKRIADLGGMIAAMTQPPEGDGTGPDHEVSILQMPDSNVDNDCQASAKTWAHSFEWALQVMDGRPVAFGTDFNGISRHNAPRFGGDACGKQTAAAISEQTNKVSYPFTVTDFGEFSEQVTGGKTYNYNEVGLAHVGLLPDMIQDLKKVGLTDEELKPLFKSAEAYIVMWEGSEAVAADIASGRTDFTAPVASANVPIEPNKNGWYKHWVTARIFAEDELDGSGVAGIFFKMSPNIDLTYRDGKSTSVSSKREGIHKLEYGAYDEAGNQSNLSSITIKQDFTAPLIKYRKSPAANAGGWNNSDVTVVFDCTDSLSGIAFCSGDEVVTEGVSRSPRGEAYDNAGKYSTLSVGGIYVDTTAPKITAIAEPAANAAGWNNSDVTVAFNCTDNLSGVVSCSDDKLLSEGASQSTTGHAVDKADNSSSITVSNINVDKTGPVVTVTGISDGEVFILGGVLPAIACQTVDDLSGVANEAVLAITGGSDVNNVGEFTVNCSGSIDIAGNEGNQASKTYYVQFDFGGFQKPLSPLLGVTVIKAGKNIPVKFSLKGDYGLDIILSGSPTSSLTSCTFLGDTSDEKQVVSKGLSYSVEEDKYNYKWKTEKAWKNSCRYLYIRLEDGTAHIARINFK